MTEYLDGVNPGLKEFIEDIDNTLSDLDHWHNAIASRQNLIYKNVPRCPACNNEQVQIMDSSVPAKWRCRVCKYKFEYEPVKA